MVYKRRSCKYKLSCFIFFSLLPVRLARAETTIILYPNKIFVLLFVLVNQAESWLLQKYPTKKTILSNNDDPSGPRETYTQTLGLRFQVNKTHFAVGDRLELKCTAKIGDLPHWQRVLIVHPSFSRYAAAAATADTTRVDTNVYRPVSPDRYRNVDGGASSNLGKYALQSNKVDEKSSVSYKSNRVFYRVEQ